MRPMYEPSNRSVNSRTNSARSSGVRAVQWRVSVRRAISSKSKRSEAIRRISARRISARGRSRCAPWKSSCNTATTRVTAVCTTSRGLDVAAIAPATISHAATAFPMAVAPGPRAEHPLCHRWHPARCSRTTLARVTGGDDNVRLSAMLRRQLRSPGLIVGVDAGGTWVRVRAIADGRGPVSLKRPVSAVPELATFLHSLWRRRGWTRRGVEALVVAARGVWLPRERRALRRRITGLARLVDVIADVEAAWHATLGAERGVLVLAGTGSIALGRDARGRWARAGGLGPLLGDEGSAFWVGREWVRATLSDGPP